MRLSILLSTLLYASMKFLYQRVYVSVCGRGYNSLSVCPIRSSIRLSDQIDGHTNNPGGGRVLGKLSVPGRPANLDNSGARAYCACSRCGWGCLDIFLSSITSLFFLPLSGRRPDID